MPRKAHVLKSTSCQLGVSGETGELLRLVGGGGVIGNIHLKATRYQVLLFLCYWLLRTCRESSFLCLMPLPVSHGTTDQEYCNQLLPMTVNRSNPFLFLR